MGPSRPNLPNLPNWKLKRKELNETHLTGSISCLTSDETNQASRIAQRVFGSTWDLWCWWGLRRNQTSYNHRKRLRRLRKSKHWPCSHSRSLSPPLLMRKPFLFDPNSLYEFLLLFLGYDKISTYSVLLQLKTWQETLIVQLT